MIFWGFLNVICPFWLYIIGFALKNNATSKRYALKTAAKKYITYKEKYDRN